MDGFSLAIRPNSDQTVCLLEEERIDDEGEVDWGVFGEVEDVDGGEEEQIES